MILNKKHAKRCGIFLFFDKDGFVDQYIINMLEDLKNSLEYILVVCNGYVQHEGLNNLRNVADDVICRANVGFDVGGYRDGLFYIGWKKLEEYDEVAMLNYTFYGPIYPFSEMFDAMAERDISFWGPTKHHHIPFDPFHAISLNYVPEHIQSHFMVLRRDLFTSYQYKDFICSMKNPSSYTESICNYEAIFTKYFSDYGFAWDVYVNTDEYEGYAYAPIMFYAKELVENKRCPIIKRRSFFTDYCDYMLNTCGESSAVLYDYLKKENLYDLNLIWDNLCRLEDMPSIHKALHLNYTLETFATDYTWDEKIAVVVMCDSSKSKPFYEKYLKEIPESVDVFTYTEGTLLQTVFADLKDKNYDYVGVAHIADVEEDTPYTTDVSRQYSDWENLFYNEKLMGNILQTFHENSRMGLCIPPVFRYGTQMHRTEEQWRQLWSHVVEALRVRNISLNIQQLEFPVTPLGGSFWIRGDMWNDMAYLMEDMPEYLEVWVLSYLAQYLGYYTGIAYSDRYMPIAITNEDFLLRKNNQTVFPIYGANFINVVVQRIRDHEKLV